jgi:BON domain
MKWSRFNFNFARTCRRSIAALACAALGYGLAHADNQPTNHFGDPFVAITKGLPSCPVPLGPMVTPTEVAEQAHWRSQRGVSCHTAGRCRLPNAYLYDKEIIPRVQLAIDSNGRFKDTSIWAMGQRRWVFLQGCVATRAQADELERIVRLIDDVESVINELMVGTQDKPSYRTR